MTRPVDVTERVGQWYGAYVAIRDELTPAAMREVLAKMNLVEGIDKLGSYMSLARNVMANDRTAATVAAMLTATGIKATAPDYTDVGEEA